ncbi:unnamed protein product [Discula destructiva]
MAASDMRSPPARPTVHDRLGIFSSSPSLPDLRDLVATKPKPKLPKIRSGSAAVPIPAAASTTFTSASDLLRTARAAGHDNSFDVDVIDEPEPPVAKKPPVKRVRNPATAPKPLKEARVAKAPKSKKEKAPKRLAKEVVVLSSDGVTPRITRYKDAAAAETDAYNDYPSGRHENEGTPLKEKPWKKFKTTTSPDQSGTGEAEVVSAKPPSKAKAQKKKKDKPETVSKHFDKEKESVEPEISDVKEKRKRSAKASTPEPINLEPAVQRRMDWTPVRPDTLIPKSSPDPFGTPEDLRNTNADGNEAATLFERLRDTYGHEIADADPASAPKQGPSSVLGKRKAIEMILMTRSTKSKETAREPSPAKAKAPKKKPRTITELATAAYGPQDTGAESNKEDSLLEYFSVEGTEQDISSGAATAKGKGKASRAAKTRRKVPSKKTMLLSPQTAMRQSAAQDFVFGTASQLAREQSPTFLRDLHAAMKASTKAEDVNSFAISLSGISSKSKPPGKGLWSISARDEEGDLVDVETIDMIHSPALPQDDAILDPWTQLPPVAAGVETGTADSSVIEIDSRPVANNENRCSPRPIPKSHFFMTQKMTINAAAALSPQTLDSAFPLVTDLLEDEMPPPSNQQQTQEEISKFGFKAVKARTGMIALLDQCWKSKTGASGIRAPFAAMSTSASPKRKQIGSGPDASTTISPAKKSRSKAKMAADADSVDAEAEIGLRVRQDSASAEDTTAKPKKKLGRPRKDAGKEDVPAVPTKRGRPRKDTAAEDKGASSSSMPPPQKPEPRPSTPKRKKAASQAVRDAEDLDLDTQIEASGFSPEQLFSPGGNGAEITIGDDTEISLNLSPTALQSTAFGYITKAVTSAPRTTDPQNPSWHEKMLMYDPVILEDLAAWLNSGELTRLGHDDEVSPQDVKRWCESRSICCLWKGNRHGKERKRF